MASVRWRTHFTWLVDVKDVHMTDLMSGKEDLKGGATGGLLRRIFARRCAGSAKG